MAQTHAAPVTGDAILIDNPYEIDWVKAGISGILATLLFSGLYAFIYLGYAEQSLNLPLILGSFITADPVAAQIVGFLIHLFIGMSIGLSYAVVLWYFHHQSNAGKGTVFGVLVFVPMFAFFLPWAVGLSARWGLPHVSVPMPDVMMNQAAHGNVGWEGPALVAFAHMMFGLLLGLIYRHKPAPLGGRRRLRYLAD